MALIAARRDLALAYGFGLLESDVVGALFSVPPAVLAADREGVVTGQPLKPRQSPGRTCVTSTTA